MTARALLLVGVLQEYWYIFASSIQVSVAKIVLGILGLVVVVVLITVPTVIYLKGRSWFFFLPQSLFGDVQMIEFVFQGQTQNRSES